MPIYHFHHMFVIIPNESFIKHWIDFMKWYHHTQVPSYTRLPALTDVVKAVNDVFTD